MATSGAIEEKRSALRPYVYVLLGFWTVTVFGLLAWSVLQAREGTVNLASQRARAHFDRDRAFRVWAASHGGVYVPIDERTPPSPHLAHIQDRDIRTPSGRGLTLMNPAYMIRQLQEEFSELYGAKGRITSLKPLRGKNSPDEWEKKALESFENGKEEVIELTEVQGEPYLRLMRPFMTEKDCLRCHAHQGYKEGDVRGGIGVSLPLKSFLQEEHRQIIATVVSHGVIFVIGLVGILSGMRRLERREDERSAAEEKLANSETFLSNIVESIQDGISVLDSDLTIVRTNPTMEQWYSHAMPLVGKKCFEAYHKADHPCETCPVAQTLRTGLTTYEVVPRKGERGDIDGWLELYAFPLIAPGSGQVSGVIEYFRDISDRKRAEEALRASEERHVAELEQGIKERTSELVVANEQLINEINERKQVESELQRSNEELQQFAYVASHDLREPLRMISSYVQLLQRRYRDKIDQDADEFIAFAVDGAKRMQGLIDGLLQYSRVGTHGKPFGRVDCETVLEKALTNLQVLIKESGAQVTFDPLPTVSADSTQLVQLFQNLIDNACKFRDDATPQIHVSARLESGQWLISVSDNGIGIDPEYADRIFIIFQRLHSREEFSGTGLGLAICKKIVERHGGRIWVEFGNRKGTTFCFTIPGRVA
jgi:chemotaxis family two-component system sensor kinase Cph1